MNELDFYNQYKDKIYSYFYYNVSQNVELSEDLTSETFLKVCKNFSSYNTQYAGSTWVYRIARNTLFDYYRTQKTDIGLENISEKVVEEFFAYDLDLGNKIDQKSQLKRLEDILSKLSLAEREVIIQKYLQENSTQEIAEKSGKTKGNIRKILSRSLEKVRAFMINNDQ